MSLAVVKSWLVDERAYQIDKFGTVDSRWMPLEAYWLVLEAEATEMRQGWLKNYIGRSGFAVELIQVTAVAVSCLEEHLPEYRGSSLASFTTKTVLDWLETEILSEAGPYSDWVATARNAHSAQLIYKIERLLRKKASIARVIEVAIYGIVHLDQLQMGGLRL